MFFFLKIKKTLKNKKFFEYRFPAAMMAGKRRSPVVLRKHPMLKFL